MTSAVNHPLRIGILGTGLAAKLLYLPALQRLNRKIEVIACSNRHRKKAETYAKLARIPIVVDTAEELLDLPGLQGLLISLPIDAQPRYVKLALSRGIAVLSEKPVAPSLAVGRALLRATAPFKTPWLVGENFHFMPHVHALLQWIKVGRLGALRMLQATSITKMDAKNPFFHTAWRHDSSFVGGYVVDAGVHLAHVVRLCAGMPIRIAQSTACFDRALSPIDSAAAVLEFKGGLLGTWTSCFSAHGDSPLLRVFGEKGCADLHWDHASLLDAKGKRTVFKSTVDSFEAQFSHFSDVVLRRAKPAVTPSDALLDLELMQSIARQHRRR